MRNRHRGIRAELQHRYCVTGSAVCTETRPRQELVDLRLKVQTVMILKGNSRKLGTLRPDRILPVTHTQKFLHHKSLSNFAGNVRTQPRKIQLEASCVAFLCTSLDAASSHVTQRPQGRDARRFTRVRGVCLGACGVWPTFAAGVSSSAAVTPEGAAAAGDASSRDSGSRGSGAAAGGDPMST